MGSTGAREVRPGRSARRVKGRVGHQPVIREQTLILAVHAAEAAVLQVVAVVELLTVVSLVEAEERHTATTG